jgi:DNA invertase Pin-like site-specific DNA recombinase
MGTVNLITTEIAAIIGEMERNGIRSSSRQSKILKRDHGIEIPPHFITEYKYRKRHEEAGV